MAGGAAEVLLPGGLVSLSCLLPLLRTHPLRCQSVAFCFRGDWSNQYTYGRLEVNLDLSEKRGGKSHLV
jgi:hypothetical protein